MGYTIEVGETRPLLDQDGQPLATTGVTGPDGGLPPFAVGLQAHIADAGGFLICHGNFEGPITFNLKKGGTLVAHDITVVASTTPPFVWDWSLGEPL